MDAFIAQIMRQDGTFFAAGIKITSRVRKYKNHYAVLPLFMQLEFQIDTRQ